MSTLFLQVGLSTFGDVLTILLQPILSRCCVFNPVCCLNSSIHLLLGQPAPRLPSPIPNITSLSSPSLRTICPKKDNFCCRTFQSSPIPPPISSLTDAFVLFAVHGMRSILLQHHISKAFILFLCALFSVQVSHP